MKKNIIWIVVGLAVIAVLIVVMSQKAPAANSEKLSVVTSFYPLYFFSQEIGGAKAEVTNITPAGAEPHDYEPTAQEIASVYDAKLFVFNGSGLDPWAEDLTPEVEARGTIAVEAVAGINASALLENTEEAEAEEEEGHDEPFDPHVWLSPVLAKQIVSAITEGFVAADTENAAYYQANAQALNQKLDALDNTYRTGLSQCQQKNFVTSHTAFAYLAATYNLNQVSITGISPEEEPSAQELAAVAAFAKKNNVKYIFFETLVSPRLAQTLATEVGAETLVLNPLEGLSDEEIAQGESYFTVMEANLMNLQTALRCKK